MSPTSIVYHMSAWHEVYSERRPHGMGSMYKAQCRSFLGVKPSYPPISFTYTYGPDYDPGDTITDRYLALIAQELSGKHLPDEVALNQADDVYAARKPRKVLTYAFCRHQFREAGYDLSKE